MRMRHTVCLITHAMHFLFMFVCTLGGCRASSLPPDLPPLAGLEVLCIDRCIAAHTEGALLGLLLARVAPRLRVLRLLGVTGLTGADLEPLAAASRLASLTVSAPRNEAGEGGGPAGTCLCTEAAGARQRQKAHTDPTQACKQDLDGWHDGTVIKALHRAAQSGTAERERMHAGQRVLAAVSLRGSHCLCPAVSQSALAALSRLRGLRHLAWESDDVTAYGPALQALSPFSGLR